MSCGVTQGSVTVSCGVTQGSVTVSCDSDNKDNCGHEDGYD